MVGGVPPHVDLFNLTSVRGNIRFIGLRRENVRTGRFLITSKSAEDVVVVLRGNGDGNATLGFGMRWINSGLRLAIPHWFFLVVSFAFAIVPWVRQLKWRFSLRTLLIATTLVAVILGAIVYAAK